MFIAQSPRLFSIPLQSILLTNILPVPGPNSALPDATAPTKHSYSQLKCVNINHSKLYHVQYSVKGQMQAKQLFLCSISYIILNTYIHVLIKA